jgi:hypothetical protein
MSEDQLRGAIANINRWLELQRAQHAKDEAELPDISDLVEAIRETVNAGDAYNAAHPDTAKTEDSPAGKRWLEAFDQLRSLLSDCDKAMEAFAR